MKTIVVLFPIIAVFLSAPAALALEPLLEYIKDACTADLEEHCKQVTPGEGRLALCLAAHEDHLGERCQYALYQGAVALEQAVAAISYVARSCSGDGQAFRCFKQLAEFGCNTFARQIFLLKAKGTTRLGKTGCIPELIIVKRVRQWNKDRRASNYRQFSD